MQDSVLRRPTLRLTLCGLFISLLVGPLQAAETFSSARVAVYFSPNGGATDAVVRELNTGSFNFTKAAEEKNAENLLVIKDAPELVTAYEATIRLHAGHAHPYERQAATASSGPAPATVSGNGEVHGNKKSRIYHLPNCPGYASMNPTSIVVFANEAAAERAGYRRAKNCR